MVCFRLVSFLGYVWPFCATTIGCVYWVQCWFWAIDGIYLDRAVAGLAVLLVLAGFVPVWVRLKKLSPSLN